MNWDLLIGIGAGLGFAFLLGLTYAVGKERSRKELRDRFGKQG